MLPIGPPDPTAEVRARRQGLTAARIEAQKPPASQPCPRRRPECLGSGGGAGGPDAGRGPVLS